MAGQDKDDQNKGQSSNSGKPEHSQCCEDIRNAAQTAAAVVVVLEGLKNLGAS